MNYMYMYNFKTQRSKSVHTQFLLNLLNIQAICK